MTIFFENNNNVVAGTAVTMAAFDQLYVRAGVFVGSSGVFEGVSAAGDAQAQIYGTVLSAGGRAFDSSLGGNSILIGAAGSLTGMTEGLHIGGTGSNIITNDGMITGATAINITGSNNTITNTGRISGTGGGIALDGGYIANTGTIAASGGFAIEATGTAGSSVVIDNSGTIARTPVHTAIGGVNAQFTVTNTGHIIGNVTFGVDNDAYNGALGSLTGTINGNSGDDVIVTGANDDRIIGSAGSDILTGGAGHDTFSYGTANSGESSGTAHDRITAFDFDSDTFSVFATVTGIDATVASGEVRADHFARDVRAGVDASALQGGHAVLFKPNTGDLAGHTFLIVDANGRAGFQTDKDYVFDITGALHLSHLDPDNFI